ncbi:protein EFR3 homolog cmp44E isoform X1 [Schistocerca cancellata]|uniref:protein EFR3 homolog cmp44E isoform X1 n=1 Tax=Schistocerca cancellata TaxID=274614 RepID=UPI0021192066|nr:protein EFR3 homolog cmp44E isoform X1 [Schistocerca cancellata]
MSLMKCCFDTELPDVVDSVIQKCTDPGCCCVCCSALRPRYKRLVDNIFPALPQDGLVKNNMEKLTFYSLSSPEKLDRIGEYLFQRASRDIHRRRTGFVVIAMEAMDQLLVACHAQTLNLFVESFLKMVQKLLESTEPQLQILATQSFVRFANIEEDTPSYHRRYDFFVSKFSSMCHSNHNVPDMRDKIRAAGIKGLQGVVRKTVSDDLVENIWEPVHMDKIVPSLLYNMQNSRYHTKEADTPEPPQEENCDPPALAETCMRELVGKASFGHIRSVLRPVLRHLDLHELWVPNQFAIHTFRIIMFSIQAQYSYTVVETLMAHLDDNSKSNPKIRTSIADVLSKIIAIAAGESVGPSVLEIINSLLMHLRVSVTREAPSDDPQAQRDEKLYQEALINALGEFANHLPDYQKIEIMMFIMSKVPYPSLDHLRGFSGPGDVLLQNILLKSLLKVGTKYQTIHFNTTFPMSFLEPLLRMSLAADPDMRLLVQKILHTLIDRHHNLDKLLKPTVNISELELTLEKSSRPDIIFIRKHGHEIYLSLYESLEQANNTVENIEAVYTTLALLIAELASEETVMDLLRLVISIQDMALTNGTLSTAQKFNLHAVVASLLVMIPNVVPIPSLREYAEKIIILRQTMAPYLLPELLARYDVEPGPIPAELLVDQAVVAEKLRNAGMDATRLQSAAPFAGQHRHSWADASAPVRPSGSGSVADLGSFQVDVDSAQSSPGIERKQPEEKLTFESMKKILSDPGDSKKEAEEEKKIQLNNTFRTAAFEELFSRTQAKNDILQNKLNEIFSKLTAGPIDGIRAPPTPTPSLKQDENVRTNPPAYEVLFPELFVY